MTRLAFYAPMKPAADPVPSGDREMARGLLRALERAGFTPETVSEFRSREPLGDTDAQNALCARARAEVARLSGAGKTWAAWVTYHNYYKAPDLLGPAVSHALGIPYILIEATRAQKRLTGPWASFARSAEAACDAADVIFYLTDHDAVSLSDLRPPGQQLIHLRPFLTRDALPPMTSGSGNMLSIGMMRQGDKLASYRIIADVLADLTARSWRLDIAGDGPARPDVDALMAPFGDRVRMLGALTSAQMQSVLADASLLLWPGVNEAYGMAYLEAQAAGLPVVAQDRPGVRDVLAPGQYPATNAGALGLAAMTDRLLADPVARLQAGQHARSHVGAVHLIGAAAKTLSESLRPVTV